MANLDYSNAVRLICNVRNVFIFSSGYVQSNVANEMKRLFLVNKIFIIEVFNIGESAFVVEFAKRLKVKGVPTISITRLSANTQFLNLMTFFLLVEFLYLNCRIYIEQQEKEFS